jgi:hypothetical protein
MNLDHAGRLIANDRAGWTADHANRVVTLHARLGELQSVVNESLTYEPGVAIVGGGTGFHAIVAPGAAVQIDHHRLTSIVQSILNYEFKQLG